MSVIEDGDIAEVLYLIPKQSLLKQLPYLNPDDYYLCEWLFGGPEDLGKWGLASEHDFCSVYRFNCFTASFFFV